MTECDNAAADGVHPLLVERFSPVSFDRTAFLSEAQVDVLLEAARLTPSAGNSQPWMFIVGRRDDPIHARIASHLAPSSARWALDASLLVVNLAHILVEDTDWEFSEFARYDLGQALAHMTIQGLVMGLGAHQFRAFDRDAVAREFDVPAEWEVTSMTALGVASPASDGSTEPAPRRTRLTRREITWASA
ncbi:nitroreductase [Mycolicibacterium mucogenicum]|uniref:Nitroreductase n=1 Tax=Mycolicibacterium mucogenicum TaxID=56689 RepID=A0A1A0MTT8_MYCMU|nr:nitroreductase family protein [Mycolicibacterium mucogenicum]MCX8553932.1 nitroreductase family protein [Mycolicibacterium mucogenicum]OBA88471.1 nitroreductase [Mycolicibacterium mucogenicum]